MCSSVTYIIQIGNMRFNCWHIGYHRKHSKPVVWVCAADSKKSQWSCWTNSSAALFSVVGTWWLGNKKHIILFSGRWYAADGPVWELANLHFHWIHQDNYFWLGRLFRNSLAIDRVGSLKLTPSIYYSKKKKQGTNGDMMFLNINIMLYMVSAFIGSSHAENS